MNRDESRKKLEQIIETFERQKHFFENDEAQTRTSLIDEFWKALGWNLTDPNEVKVERKVEQDIGGMKRVDYVFKVSGKEKFILEAKPPKKNLRDKKIIYQLINYGWHMPRVELGILHDFEEFRVFDVRLKPNEKNPERGLIKEFDLTYKDYIEKFDLLYGTFSREAVLSGSLDKLIPESRRKARDKESLDKTFFEDLMKWRLNLAKNIVKENPEADENSLNEATNMLILRALFLRITEDRDIEGKRLDSILREWERSKDKPLYDYVVGHFKKLNPKYNGILFKEHFSDNYKIDDKPLYEFLTNLYPPECGYRFDLMPIELPGNAYERFLGTVIRITPKRILKAELKPEVRKAGGIYYTPKYIVDYIVRETVGKLLEGKNPSRVSKLKILDPACGSGSFLIGTYEAIYNYLLNWYKTHTKFVKKGITGADLERDSDGQEKLGFHIKRSILLNNLYGVDIDPQAVEVTMFSLYVKLMEGERPFMFKEVLPDLSRNIKCGNSLIGTDIFDEEPELFENRELRLKINPFDWEKGFPEILKSGDFDAVIGNPPYSADISALELEYLERKFKLGNTNTAALFMAQQRNLLKNGGLGGFIVPKSFIFASNWGKTRKILLPDILSVADVSRVWKEVLLEMVIYIQQKGTPRENYTSYTRKNEDIVPIGNIAKELCDKFGFILSSISPAEIAIAEKMKATGVVLNDLVINQRGATLQKHITDKPSDFQVLGGKQIGRYSISETPKGWISKKDINDEKAYIKPKSILAQNIIAHIENPFDHVKIIATIYEKKDSIILDTINQFENKSDYSSSYILGVINSRLISWFVYRFIFAKAIRTMHFDSPVTSRVPIPKLDLSHSTDKTKHDRLVSLVERILALHKELHQVSTTHEKEQIQRLIQRTDEEIDSLVYKLYGLTEEEIKIVESSFR